MNSYSVISIEPFNEWNLFFFLVLPPSFPYSQIITSTPKAKPSSSVKHNPEPIPFTASPIESPVSPSSSSRVTKVYEQQVKSSSLPAIPSTSPLPPVPTTHPETSTTNDYFRLPIVQLRKHVQCPLWAQPLSLLNLTLCPRHQRDKTCQP